MWKHSLGYLELEGLPPCPDALTEPAWITFMLTPWCTVREPFTAPLTLFMLRLGMRKDEHRNRDPLEHLLTLLQDVQQ